MSVLLGDTNIGTRVAHSGDPEAATKRKLPMRIDVRQAIEPQSLLQAADLHHAIFQSDIADLDVDVAGGRPDLQAAGPGIGQERIEARKAASRERLPGELVGRDLTKRCLGVPEIDRVRTLNAVVLQQGRAVPCCIAATATALGTLPDDTNASTEIISAIGSNDLHEFKSVTQLDPLDGCRAKDVELDFDLIVFDRDDIAHDRRPNLLCWAALDVRITEMHCCQPFEMGGNVKPDARSARRVMMPGPEALEQRIPAELLHEVAGQSAISSKLGGSRVARTRPALVIVASANDADRVTGLERIAYEP